MNKILDYEQVINKLYSIVNEKNITECKPIGYSRFGLPISNYSFGNGKKHIVVTGATHGAEIISTDFVLKLMEYIPNYVNKDEFTIYFIPMLNPEGYLISTSVIRKIIPRDMLDNDAQIIIKKYIEDYNSHDLSYQDIFANVDYTCIPEKYNELRENIKSICYKYNIPKGTLQVWSANGSGIDLNQNCPYNKKMDYIKEHKKLYGNGAYSNIIVTLPGPIGCPSKSEKFEYEPETKSFRDFIINLRNNYDFCSYLNYHSAEDTVFYKPIYGIVAENMLQDITKITEYNKKLAEIYVTNTSQKLYEGETKFCCFNDMLRLEIPGDILVELCPNEGNPLSAYDKNVYNKTINENLKAVIDVIKYCK